MALINGNNESGKLFDVVDEDGQVLGSFDHIDDAATCGRAAPWYSGRVNIRRDIKINSANHARAMAIKAEVRATMDFGAL